MNQFQKSGKKRRREKGVEYWIYAGVAVGKDMRTNLKYLKLCETDLLNKSVTCKEILKMVTS
jgi:hypothetical protein